MKCELNLILIPLKVGNISLNKVVVVYLQVIWISGIRFKHWRYSINFCIILDALYDKHALHLSCFIDEIWQ